MTLCVLWLSETGVFAAADSRLISGDHVVTDNAVKIFALPIISRRRVSEAGALEVAQSFALGFAYAGSSVTAVNSLAVAQACTQNLVQSGLSPISVEEVSELVRRASTEITRDTAGRITQGQNAEFAAFVFGYCPATESYQAFKIAALREPGGTFAMGKTRLELRIGVCYAIGSGTESFSRYVTNVTDFGPRPNMLRSVREIFDAAGSTGVGGHLQVGIAERSGFEVRPVLTVGLDGSADMYFLGININSLRIDGYDIGHSAYSPDI